LSRPDDIPAATGALADTAALVRTVHGEPVRVVVIDPETAFTRTFARRAEILGWQARVFSSAPAAEALDGANAVVLDSGACPDLWGFMETIAVALPVTGLLLLSRESTVGDRVRALRLGADDWIKKPAHPEEVLARVNAVVRRRQGAVVTQQEGGPVTAGELEIRPDRFQAYVGGQSVGLTRREYELLELLARAGGRVFEREDIYLRVWGYAMVRGDRSVDVFVGKIRNKLAALSPGWRYVHTHFGVGYRFDPEPAGDD
jgi:DNA-binding response OmpR family regulator